ncbi:tachykinin-3 isoform X1 [Apus apus]|uniref:tachykinin-3 isoform X1 n=1 Tax=Apus apus TaxID=8895 RepID=UPI0021F87687|nr:tachykinin-3 isoform X1 [Apus apus]
MRSHRALAALLVLALPLALARRPSAPPDPAPPAQGMPIPEPLPRRARSSPGAAYAALLRLLEEEDAGKSRGGCGGSRSGPRLTGAAHPPGSLPGASAPAAPQKRKSRPAPVPGPVPGPAALTAGLSAGDMHDFFVGLMGKRAAGRGSGDPSPRCSPGTLADAQRAV